ncbi:AraC family transcriptional regulator [Rhodanobacter glycinis]|uniref:AraC family transcriptional regulator n=1 Tax=Rhodanobacter glycinis TaxID=582702 RepID=A0A5B9DYH0_9GAMM|nr:AraC family transcriptional regulator [Rhodanobacter glycinis]QEE24234.1 AraC family transcriptional regulator [Rhodanobacter glycinis]
MDSLAALVTSMRLRGSVDLLCRFAGMWSVDEEARESGTVRYHMVLEGRAHLESGRTHIDLAGGDLVLFPHGAAHTLRSSEGRTAVAYPVTRQAQGELTRVDSLTEQHDYDMLCGSFELGQSHSLLLQSLPEVVHVSTQGRDDCAWLLALMRLMRHESAQPLAGAPAVIDDLSRAMFTIVLRILMEQGAFTHGLLALLTDARMAPAIAAVIDTPAEAWTLERMAERSRMSRASFARHFAELSEMTPLDLVTSLRMEQAARLLRDTRRSIELIGESCGYATHSAFGRAFKRHYGMSPAAWRRAGDEPNPS